jgi:5-deoxy-glucuronate isomerase
MVAQDLKTKASKRAAWTYSAGDLARDGWGTVVDGAIDGWQYTGLRVANLSPTEKRTLPAVAVERIVVPLAGSFSVTFREQGKEAETRELAGRLSVFTGPSDVLYLGAFCQVEISGDGRVAVAEAPTSEVLPSVYVPRESIAIELRGAGRNSRQVHNFGTPANLHASVFMVVEVITPSMNWSSFPPHKHDADVDGREAALEEIYYFETAVARNSGPQPGADPVGYLRAYPSEVGEIEYLEEVRTGDVALCPFGFHGPAVAAPGSDLYFLNVMAGPAHKREWLVTEDSTYTWVRDTFRDELIDPRLPYDGER